MRYLSTFREKIKPVSQRDRFARFDRIVNRLEAFSRLSKFPTKRVYEELLFVSSVSILNPARLVAAFIVTSIYLPKIDLYAKDFGHCF